MINGKEFCFVYGLGKNERVNPQRAGVAVSQEKRFNLNIELTTLIISENVESLMRILCSIGCDALYYILKYDTPAVPHPDTLKGFTWKYLKPFFLFFLITVISMLVLIR